MGVASLFAGGGLGLFEGSVGLCVAEEGGEFEVERGGEHEHGDEGGLGALVLQVAHAGIAHACGDGERLLRPPHANALGMNHGDDLFCDLCVQVWHAQRNMGLSKIRAQS